jgi:hypothetical protein
LYWRLRGVSFFFDWGFTDEADFTKVRVLVYTNLPNLGVNRTAISTRSQPVAGW